jgi:hypothetical protein
VVDDIQFHVTQFVLPIQKDARFADGEVRAPSLQPSFYTTASLIH